MTLIPNARDWYKMASVQALIVIGSIQAVLGLLPPETLDAAISGTFTWRNLGNWASIAAAAVGAVGRVVDQHLSAPPAEEPKP